jgi:non-lysosomal glucosylceramidase
MSTADGAHTVPAGVPLGGIGAGCIELGFDGRFRNITINNNRTAETRIPEMPGTFLAVRASVSGRVHSRILQSSTGLPWSDATITPPCAPVEHLTWRGLYPTSRYELSDTTFPLATQWSYLCPIIPFDLDASTMPAILCAVTLRNPSDNYVQASAVLNWENICGCTRLQFPHDRGSIEPLYIKAKPNEGHGDASEEEQRRLAGLRFGKEKGLRTSADGHYCVMVKPRQDVGLSVMQWDGMDPSELDRFWQAFMYDADLGGYMSSSPTAFLGATCCTFDIPPESSRTIHFALAWYCPNYVIRGKNLGNAYTTNYPDARTAAIKALKYASYFQKAIDGWQGSLIQSSLPRWLPRMLINSLSSLSTNATFTKENRFAMMETPESPSVGILARRFHSSFATLLFYPELADRELTEFAKAEDPDQPGRICGRLGLLAPIEPHFGEGSVPTVELGPMFILMVYRNYQMTGRKFAMEHLQERMRAVMQYMVGLDTDGDGLPDHNGADISDGLWPLYGANSYTASLWIAALRAYSRMVAKLGQEKEAQVFEGLFTKATASFDKKLWDEDAKYYRLYASSADVGEGIPRNHPGCHDGQLAGQWYADFLSLGTLFPTDHVKAAAKTMLERNDTGKGVCRGVMPDDSPWWAVGPEEPVHVPGIAWPSFSIGHYACLQITRGHCDRGLYAVHQAYENVDIRGRHLFSKPFQWDLTNQQAFGLGADRHVSGSSVWHVLYALQGFLLDAADQAVWIRPHLPMNVNSLDTPLFTPLCHGYLRFKQKVGRPYKQEVRLTFDSPVALRTIVLALPNDVNDVQVELVNDGVPVESEHYIGRDGDEKLVEIAPHAPLMVAEGLRIVLQDAPGGAA